MLLRSQTDHRRRLSRCATDCIESDRIIFKRPKLMRVIDDRTFDRR